MLTAMFASAQTLEVNPNIDAEWRFVRTQELNLESGNFYSFEFPAEKGYDYIFNLAHKRQKVHTVISIFDMQDQLIERLLLNESTESADLHFDIKHTGTYKVIVGLTDPKATKGVPMTSQFSLIRRVKF